MYKVYKFRMHLTDNQKELVHKTFSCTRFVYNHFLGKYKENGYQKAYDMCKELKKLLSRILKKNIEIIEFLRSELPVVSTVDKVKTVDLLVRADEEYLHIELNCNYADYLHTRNFIYFTNIYSRKEENK